MLTTRPLPYFTEGLYIYMSKFQMSIYSTNWRNMMFYFTTAIELLTASVRDGRARCGCIDINTGRMSRAGEGLESRDGLEDERTEVAQACSGTEWYFVGKWADRGSVEFSDDVCYYLILVEASAVCLKENDDLVLALNDELKFSFDGEEEHDDNY